MNANRIERNPETEVISAASVATYDQLSREASRIAVLEQYEILHTEREVIFDDLARIAASVCTAPIAFISFAARDFHWFKTSIGVSAPDRIHVLSLCRTVVDSCESLAIEDATQDARFSSDRWVVGAPHVRCYAAAPILTSEGHAIGTVGVIDTKPRAITSDALQILRALAKQAMALLELRRSVATSQKANRYRSRLMAIAGHDLKQPLQKIALHLGLMQMKVPDAYAQERVTLALAAIEELGMGLDELAEASLLGEGDGAPTLSRVPVRAFARVVHETWRDLALQKGLNLRVFGTAGHMFANDRALTTIIGNLIGNAIKYTDRGGVVVAFRRKPGLISIEVVDSGRGIRSDKLEILFQPFTKEDPASDGLGLGLSIVKQTADLLGYALNVATVLGRGSRFTFDVPDADARALE